MSFGTTEMKSIWQGISQPFTTAMSSHQSADVCIIGGGISGLTTAYCLLRSGKTVVVLERDTLGMGQTGRTSAHLSNALDDRYTVIQRLHGKEGARLAADSHTQAIDFIESIVHAEGLDCDFERVNGYLFLDSEHDLDDLRREMEASHEAGLKDVQLLSSAPARLFHTGPCLLFPRQAQFHPVKYIHGLAMAIQKMGGKIFTHTEAITVEGGRPARVTTNRGFQVVSDSIVVAANVPFNDRVTMHTKMYPYRTYMLGFRVPRIRAEAALFWDMADPYHYIRTIQDPNNFWDTVIIGGEDHRTGQESNEEECFSRLQNWTRERIGIDLPPVIKWSGQVIEPHDAMAFIGRNPGDEENVYIVTGDSGNGLTHGTIAGMLLRDMITGIENEWESLYDPSRITLRSIDTLVRENVNSNLPYREWISGGDVESIQDIRPGEGAVVRHGMQKLACYKENSGRVHLYSAVCPHLGGIVHWNNAEKTWDCPCHGSRFDRMGNVLNGPANKGLQEVADTSIREQDAASA